MELIFLLFIPVIIGLAGLVFGKGRITLKEFLIQEAVIVVLITAGFFIARQVNAYDKEIWSGKVVRKAQEKVSCEHSYSCNCIPVSCGKNCTTIVCRTCYDHSYDYDWNLYTSNEEKIKIKRIDRQGAKEPPRFAKAGIGDPTALSHEYTNYIKANPRTILKRDGFKEKYEKFIPPYPIQIYDYHYVDRFLTPGLAVIDALSWNGGLMKINAEVGKEKKVNVIIAAVPVADSAYIHALEEAWLGGKKNDLVLILGVPDFPKISWVRVMSWTRAEELKIELRGRIEKIGTMEKREEILKTVKDLIVQNNDVIRRPMADFEYLNASVRPPFWAMVLIFVLGVGSSIGLTIFFYKEDLFDEENVFDGKRRK